MRHISQQFPQSPLAGFSDRKTKQIVLIRAIAKFSFFGPLKIGGGSCPKLRPVTYIHNNFPCLHWRISEIRLGKLKKHQRRNITRQFIRIERASNELRTFIYIHFYSQQTVASTVLCTLIDMAFLIIVHLRNIVHKTLLLTVELLRRAAARQLWLLRCRPAHSCRPSCP